MRSLTAVRDDKKIRGDRPKRKYLLIRLRERHLFRVPRSEKLWRFPWKTCCLTAKVIRAKSSTSVSLCEWAKKTTRSTSRPFSTSSSKNRLEAEQTRRNNSDKKGSVKNSPRNSGTRAALLFRRCEKHFQPAILSPETESRRVHEIQYWFDPSDRNSS